MADIELGPLAVALSKAQREFGPINRSKTVTVQTKTGGSYSFSYAPLDAILGQVRKPLSDNELTLTQLLDAEGLVTLLIHSSGAYLRGITALPETTDVQAFGSAITYLRRYSIQAILGIAAEEDDDGNRAAGNNATATVTRGSPVREPVQSTEPEPEGPYSGTGAILVRKSGVSDGNLRQSPEGAYLIVAFAPAEQGKLIPQAKFGGALATDVLDAAEGRLDGLVCTLEGELYRVPWDKEGRQMPPYQRLVVKRITTAGWTLPQATSVGQFDAAAERELDGLLL